MQGGTTFFFVRDGIESALEQARAAAGDKDVFVGGARSHAHQIRARVDGPALGIGGVRGRVERDAARSLPARSWGRTGSWGEARPQEGEEARRGAHMSPRGGGSWREEVDRPRRA
jgi:hypothetical protein